LLGLLIATTSSTFATAAKKWAQEFSRGIADATEKQVSRKSFAIWFEFEHRHILPSTADHVCRRDHGGEPIQPLRGRYALRESPKTALCGSRN
jgi:hypothetical protein